MSKELEQKKEKAQTQGPDEKKMGPGINKQKLKVGITERGNEILSRYLGLINQTSKRRVHTPEILEFAIEKLSEKDVPKIQERVYTTDDKIEVMLDEYNEQNPEKPMTREQMKAAMLEAFEKLLIKQPKNLKMRHLDPKTNVNDMDQ